MFTFRKTQSLSSDSPSSPTFGIVLIVRTQKQFVIIISITKLTSSLTNKSRIGGEDPASYKAKAKRSRYRPGEALWVPGGWGSKISRQSTHESGSVVSPTHRPSLPAGTCFLYLGKMSTRLLTVKISPYQSMKTDGGWIFSCTFSFKTRC